MRQSRNDDGDVDPGVVDVDIDIDDVILRLVVFNISHYVSDRESVRKIACNSCKL